MNKIISFALTVTCTVSMALMGLVFVPVASAAAIDGEVVSPDVTFLDDDGITYYPYDVFIVKVVGDKTFKRLVLNPAVFDSYGHLNWEDVKIVSATTVASYTSSTLVRPIDDEEVYNLIPDGDTGTKKWVESLDCFNSQSYDWDSVYIINAIDRDNYTTDGGTVCGGSGTTGDMTLSLASSNPVAATLPPNAQGVTFMSIRVAGTGIINQLTLKRLGAGAVADFGDIYIYENGVRLTSGRSISSATSKVTFINLGINTPTTIEVVADMTWDGTTGATAGDINYFGIESASDVTADATVGGTFPLNGNPMGISGTNAGTLTIANSGSGSRNVTIGAQEVEISEFKISVSTEGTNLYRMQLFNGGTADSTKITNLELKDNVGVTVATATTIGSDGYVAFVFDTPYYIKKGDNEIFRVYADIGAVKPDRTIILYQELATDLLGTGTTYGFGMAVTDDNFVAVGTTSTKGIDVACKGGDLTLNKIGPNADNIGTDTDDTVFLEYTMTAAADITIKRTELVLCLDHGANGFDSITSAGADIEDIKIVDKDTGTVIAGPKDGTAFNDGVRAICPDSANGAYEDFTDTFDLSAGEQKTLQITADVKIANTGSDIIAADIIKFMLYGYANLAGNVNNLKYSGTADAVSAAAIAPSGNISGEEMTLAAPSLTLTLAASPSGSDGTDDERVYVKGQTGVEAVGIIFTAGEASDVTVDTITLISHTTYDTGAAFVAGIAGDNYVKDSIGSVYIYDTITGEMIHGSSAKGFTSGDDYEYVDYTGLNWTIPAGEDRTMLVKVDISSASPASASGAADLWFAFDIETAATNVTATDKDGTSVNATGNKPNGLTATNTDFGIADYGALTIAVASDTPDRSLLIMGTEDNEVSKFKLTGTYEAWQIEKFGVGLYDGDLDATNSELNDRDTLSGVALKYQTESQYGTDNWTISSKKGFGATASLAFNFTGDNRIYVPKDDDTYIAVLVDVKAYLGGTGGKSKVPVMINHSTSETTGFKAYGAQSGKQLTSLTAVANSNFNLHFVARSKPVFAKTAWSGSELEMARFTITAVGHDIVFAGTAGIEADLASACLRFDVLASSTTGTSGDLTLYDWNEDILASADDVTWGVGAGTSVSFLFEEKDATVPSGTTKEFHIDLATADLADFPTENEYLFLQLRNDDGGDLATGAMGFGQRDIVFHDGTHEEGINSSASYDANAELRFGMPALIKNIGSLPITFRTLRGNN